MTTTQAVILAAGLGSRLRPLTDDRPKALVPLGGQPLLGHALDALVAHGVTSVVLVVGYAREAVAAYVAGRSDLTLRCVENPEYAVTNTLGSLLCAEPLVHGDLLLLDGDLVFEPAVLGSLTGEGTRLAIDRGRTLDDDAVKIALDGDRIVAVGKRLSPPATGVAESIGLARIDAATAAALFAVGRRLLGDGARQAYYEAAFQALIEEGVGFAPADVTGLRWAEIDDHEDLRHAEELFVAA